VALGGDPELREDFMTDNHNYILDIYGLDIADPSRMENELNQIPGIVTVGLFAARPADILLTAQADGQIIRRDREIT